MRRDLDPQTNQSLAWDEMRSISSSVAKWPRSGG